MTLKEEQGGPMEPERDRAELPAQPRSVDEARRRFAKSGLAASGVILTLASRPVLGGDAPLACKSPSAWISGNGSTHGPEPVCMGRSPGYWKNHANRWPISPDTRFKDIFTDCSPRSVYFKYTMRELCAPHHDDKHNLGMHLVAAYLNALMGWTPFLPIATIRAMFTEWQSTWYFSPTAGVKWDAAQIVEYLTATQG